MQASVIAQIITYRNSSGGVLSPLLWSLVAYEDLKNWKKSTKLIPYADDIAILLTRKYLDIINNVMDNALSVIHRLAISTNLEVNADKTDMITFARRYKIPSWKPPRLNGVDLTIKGHNKYLGVILDSKLMCKLNVKARVKKTTGALYGCNKMRGPTCGIRSGLMHWCNSGSQTNLTLRRFGVVDRCQQNLIQKTVEADKAIRCSLHNGSAKIRFKGWLENYLACHQSTLQ